MQVGGLSGAQAEGGRARASVRTTCSLLFFEAEAWHLASPRSIERHEKEV